MKIPDVDKWLPEFIGLMIVIFLLLIFFSVAIAQEYTDTEYVEAIWQAEGGSLAEYPYGIRSVSCDTVADCRQVAYNTIVNNRKRYADYGYKDFDSYLEFLGSRFAPVNADNDSKGLNRNWLKNMEYFLKRGHND